MEELKIEPLENSELFEINGGNWAVGLLLSFAYDVISDWEANKAAFNKGYARRNQ